MSDFPNTDQLANQLNLKFIAGEKITHDQAVELIQTFRAESDAQETVPDDMRKMPGIVEAIERLAARIDGYMTKTRQAGDTTGLLVSYFHLTEGYKKLDEARKLIYHIKDRHDKGVIPKLFEDLKQDKIQVPEVARSFYPVVKWSSKVKDKAKAFDWLPTVGLGSLITETINSSELAAALKERLLETGEEPPEDIIELKSYETTGMSRYNPKKEK